MTDTLSVFVITPSQEEARKIALAVVEEKLAACANIFPSVHSIYCWQDEVKQADECALLIKIVAKNFDALQARVKELHSYQCPCIVAWPIVEGNSDYLRWLGGL